MITLTRVAGAVALAGIAAAPAAARVQIQPVYPPTTYPQPYPQPGYGYPGYGYPGYNYPNTGQGVIGQVIDNLLGNRYNRTDRWAVSQCAQASVIQAQNQYQNWGYGMPGYNQWGNNWRRNYNRMRVVAITDVDRRGNGLRVSGLIDSGRSMYTQGYGGYRGNGDLSFRCNVDWRGSVTNIRIRENNGGWRRY